VEADASAAFTSASADFANSADTAAGLTQLYIGLDDDLLGAPSVFEVGEVDALTGAPLPVNLASDFEISFADPASLTAATTEAQTFYAEGVTLATAITSLPTTDYADTALDNALSYIDQVVLPDQILSIGEYVTNGI